MTTEAKDKTDNELIAVFLGWEKTPQVWGNEEHAFTCKFPSSYNHLWIPSIMPFRTSWDWLMPVVEKIEAMPITLINIYSDATKIWVDDNDQNELFGFTSHGNKDNKIGHVYRAVVEYIKWWNDTHSE